MQRRPPCRFWYSGFRSRLVSSLASQSNTNFMRSVAWREERKQSNCASQAVLVQSCAKSESQHMRAAPQHLHVH